MSPRPRRHGKPKKKSVDLSKVRRAGYIGGSGSGKKKKRRGLVQWLMDTFLGTKW
tara:strand:+ start:6859 stop:7023 length:165 start_codon:yes stop_codon:yes gene_type:complete